MARTVTWLHISDLHSRAKTEADARRVNETLIKDLRVMSKKHGLRPDFIFFTGDAAWGNERDGSQKLDDQFKDAHGFLTKVREAFEPAIKLDRLFLVPGNHDVDRSAATKAITHYLGRATLEELVPQFAAADPDWQNYMKRLDAYRDFLVAEGYHHLLTDKSRLIYTHAVNLDEDLRVGIAGFNTAWSCDANEQRGKLWFCGDAQNTMLFPGVEDAQLRIALMHHPFDWLQKEPSESRSVPETSFQRDYHFLLHGHEHSAWVAPTKQPREGGPDHHHVRVAAGAAYEGSFGANGYNFVQLDLDKGKGKVFLQRYESRGDGWVTECVTNCAPQGIWPIDCPKLEVGNDRTSKARETASTDPHEPPSFTLEERRYEQIFLKAVRERHNYLDLPGVSRSGSAEWKYELSVAYVSLSLGADDGGKLAKGMIQPASRRVEEVLEKMPLDSGRLLITGPAGCGKSTLLRWIAVQGSARSSWVSEGGGSVETEVASSDSPESSSGSQAIQSKIESMQSAEAVPKAQEVIRDPIRGQQPIHGAVRRPTSSTSGNCIPFLVRLRDCPNGKMPVLSDFVRLVTPYISDPPSRWLARLLFEGRAFVMFDGFDEVPPDNRADMRQSINEFIAAHPKCHYVLTTRPDAVDAKQLAGNVFEHLTVQPLNADDQQAFIDHWHKAVEQEMRNSNRPRNLATVAEELKKQLQENVPVSRLAGNPLLLAATCALHLETQAQLPKNEAELCESLCHLLLHKRDAASPGVKESLDAIPSYRDLPYKDRKECLAALACVMLEEGVSALDMSRMEKELGSMLERLGKKDPEQVEECRKGFIGRSGLLRIGAEDRVEFLHNTFKEYLAAGRYRDIGRGCVARLAGHASEPAWQPVLRYFTAIVGSASGLADQLVEEVFKLYPGGRRKVGQAKTNARRAAHLLLAQCRPVAALMPELQARIDVVAKEFLPPHTLSDAEAIAACGEHAIPHLALRAGMSAAQRKACVRALGLIHGPRAIIELRRYSSDSDEHVLAELCSYLEPCTLPAVQCHFLAEGVFPSWVQRSRVRDLTSLFQQEGISNLRTLDLSNTNPSDISVLAKFEHLEHLDLSAAGAIDVSGLSVLKQIQSIKLNHVRVFNVKKLTGLPKLVSLSLQGDWFVDHSTLAEITQLKELDLSGSNVKELGWIVPLTQLKTLNLSRTRAKEVGPLAALSQLESLDLSFTAVTDVSMLASLTLLRDLDLSDTVVREVSGLERLTRIERLNLNNTRVSGEEADRLRKRLPNAYVYRWLH